MKELNKTYNPKDFEEKSMTIGWKIITLGQRWTKTKNLTQL